MTRSIVALCSPKYTATMHYLVGRLTARYCLGEVGRDRHVYASGLDIAHHLALRWRSLFLLLTHGN